MKDNQMKVGDIDMGDGIIKSAGRIHFIGNKRKHIPITVWQQLDKRITIASTYDPKIDLKHIRNSGGRTYLVTTQGEHNE